MADERRIGYFSQLKWESQFIGGILITNQFSIPLEFKYTEPIIPTKMQKVLFGKALDTYIKDTLVRDQLAKEISLKPVLYIVGHEDRYNLAPIDNRDTVAVQKVPVQQTGVVGKIARIKDREIIVQLEESDFLRLTFATVDETVQQRLAHLIIELSQSMDVAEPLERVEQALKGLCQDDMKA